MAFARNLILLVIAGSLSVPALSGQHGQTMASETKPEVTEASDARSRLEAMTKTLAGAKGFSVSMRLRYDVVQASGQKIQFSELRQVTLSRPDKLRVHAKKSDGSISGLLFDGKTITLFTESEKVYSRTDHPGNLDGAIRYALGKLRMRVPLARLLVTSFPQELQRLTTEESFVEHNSLGPTPTDHIAARGENVDLQLWIGSDNLPRRIVLSYKNSPGQPQFQAELIDWNMEPKVSQADFEFTPPKDFEKIPTLLPVSRAGVMDKTKGAAQ